MSSPLEGIRDPACTACKLGPEAKPSDVCLLGSPVVRPEVMVVVRVPLSARGRDKLDGLLAEAGIDPARTYVTAANKCRAWSIDPGKADVKACSPYLDREIEALSPGLVVTMGNEALLSLTGRSGILKYRGKTFERGGARIVPTISVAMTERNPGLRAGLVADLSYAARFSKGQDAPTAAPSRVPMVTSPAGIQALTERLRAAEGVSFDIETNGFDEFKPESRIVTLAMTCWGKGDTVPRDVWVLPLGHPASPWLESWRDVLRRVWDEGLSHVPKVVAHNGKFDARWLHQFGADIQLTFDTMLAAHLLDENRPKGLKPLAQSLLGVEPWAIDTRSLDDVPLKTVARYNALDTWWTAHLYFVFRDQLVEQPRLKTLFQRMLVPASNVFTDIEREGIWTDRAKLDTHAVISQRTLDDIDARLLELAPEPDAWPEGIKVANFNPSNFARWLLFDHLGLPVLERGKPKDDGSEGAPSMAEAVMQTLQRDHPHPVIDLMLERTKWQKYSSAFFSAYQEQLDDDDRIHTTFKITGTVTGRLSSGKGDADKVTGRVQNRGVNLQQVPRDDFVRGIFGAPPGSVFVECDYSQVELRVAAFLAREPTMISLYRTGQDIHMAMAMRMTGKAEADVTKEERKKAKAVNFGFLYGMGWMKFIDTAWSNYGVVTNQAEAQSARRAFFDQFSALPEWHNRQRRLASKFGRVESPLGRVRHLPDIGSANPDVKAEAQRQAINSPVQSFASDMTVLSLVTLDRLFRARGYRAHSVGTVHDAINFEVPRDELTRVVPMIRKVMEGLPLDRWFGVHLDVPIVADVKVGHRWGGAHEVPGDVSCSRDALEAWLDVPGNLPDPD